MGISMSNTGMIKEVNTLKSKFIKTITIFYQVIKIIYNHLFLE